MDAKDGKCLPRGLMQVCHLAAAVVASKVLAQQNCRAVFAEPLGEIGGIEHALVLAAAADCYERHLGLHELAERAPEVAIVSTWRSHVHRVLPGHLGLDFGSMNSPLKRPRNRWAWLR